MTASLFFRAFAVLFWILLHCIYAPSVFAQTLKLTPLASTSDTATPGMANQLFKASQNQLLQIRTVSKKSDSQRTIGSGFIVSPQGHAITNYHVVQTYLFEPDKYRLVYARPDGREGALEVIDIDVANDLALIRIAHDPKNPSVFPYLDWRSSSKPLEKGDRIYAMGNPEDIGFSITEGTYNGYQSYMFTKVIYFSGSLNPGMSGGPVVDDMGSVIGINVSAYRESQQLSFLVPAEHAQALYVKNKDQQKSIAFPVFDYIRDQLLAYQDTAVSRVLSQPWRSVEHDRYQIPVPKDMYFRCWGSSKANGTMLYEWEIPAETSACVTNQSVFIETRMDASDYFISIRTMEKGEQLPIRFLQQYSDWFGAYNDDIYRRSHTTPSKCTTADTQAQGLPIRVITCLRGYTLFSQLYDYQMILATLDSAHQGVIARVRFSAISLQNAKKLTAFYLQGISWKKP